MIFSYLRVIFWIQVSYFSSRIHATIHRYIRHATRVLINCSCYRQAFSYWHFYRSQLLVIGGERLPVVNVRELNVMSIFDRVKRSALVTLRRCQLGKVQKIDEP